MSHLKEARFRVTTGPKEGFGTTPQGVLTALMRKTSGDAFSPIIIWPYNLGDAYFTEAQQARLQELKGRQETLTADESRVGRANRSLLRCHHSPHEGTDASATEERTLMNVPAIINKLFKVVQYGYLREPSLPSATSPSGLVLHEGLIRPVENIAICEFHGEFVPVFCTRDWKMVPAGFDSTLEQN